MTQIKDVKFDLENGFAWASTDDEANNFQVCLRPRVDGKGYKKEILADDCGHDDGICGDYNVKVHGSFDAVRDFLPIFIKAARKSGFKILSDTAQNLVL